MFRWPVPKAVPSRQPRDTPDSSVDLRILEKGDGPLGGDQRVVVGAGADLRTLLESLLYQPLRRCTLSRGVGTRAAERLRGDAEHAEAGGPAPWQHVKERLLLNEVAQSLRCVVSGHI